MNTKHRTVLLAGTALLSLCFFLFAVLHRQHRLAQASISGAVRAAQQRVAAPLSPRSPVPRPHPIAGVFPNANPVRQSLAQRTGASLPPPTATLSLASFKPLDSAMPLNDPTTTALPTALRRFHDAVTSETRPFTTITTATLSDDAPTSAATDGDPRTRLWSPNVEGTVFGPAGVPLADADVYLCDRAILYELVLLNDRYYDRLLRSYAQVTTTKQDGVFQFRTRASAYTIVVRHASGIALRTSQDFSNHGEIMVLPRGRLEGTINDGDNHLKPHIWLGFSFRSSSAIPLHLHAADLYYHPRPIADLPLSHDPVAAQVVISYYAVTDDAGHFVIDWIQAGTVVQVFAVKALYSDGRVFYINDMAEDVNTRRRAIPIKPGETTRIQIDGTWLQVLPNSNPTPKPAPAAK